MAEATHRPIVLISHRPPEVGRSGHGAYVHEICAHLAATGHTLHLVLTRDAPLWWSAAAYEGQLQMSGGGAVSIGTLHLNASLAAWLRILLRKARRRWRKLRGGPVVDRGIDRRAARAAARAVDALRPSLVLYDTIHAIPIKALTHRPAPSWVITHDVAHLRAATLPDGHPDREQIHRDAEIGLLRAMDVVVAIQPEEARTFQKMVPDRTVITLPMPVRTQVTAPLRDREPVALFVGARSEYNAAGLRWFLSEVWPRVREVLPTARLEVCGTVGSLIVSPPPGVSIRGRVPDLTPYYERAALTVAPLLAGSGLKIKIVEGFAYGLPCAATSLAARGVPLGESPAMLVADEPAPFADAVVALMSQSELRYELSEGAIQACARLGPPGVFGEWDAALNQLDSLTP